jgi:hypothetical protein
MVLSSRGQRELWRRVRGDVNPSEDFLQEPFDLDLHDGRHDPREQRGPDATPLAHPRELRRNFRFDPKSQLPARPTNDLNW